MKISRFVIALVAPLTALVVTRGSQQIVSALNAPVVGPWWPDCTTASEEFCVEKLEFTPSGSSTAQTITDAVPAMGSTLALHPNTSALVSLNSLNNNLYGKMGLGAIDFQFSDPAFETIACCGRESQHFDCISGSYLHDRVWSWIAQRNQ